MEGQNTAPPFLHIIEVRKGEQHEFHFDHYLSPVAARRIAPLAVQPKLGIRWKWPAWVSFAPGNPGLDFRLPVISEGPLFPMSRKPSVFLACAGPIPGACTLDTEVLIIPEFSCCLEEIYPSEVVRDKVDGKEF